MGGAKRRGAFGGLLTILALSTCIAGAACSKKKDKDVAPAGPEKTKHALRSYIRSETPKRMTNKLDVDFDGKVKLLGYRLDPPSLTHGKNAKLTLYWKSVAKVDEGFQLSTYLLDGSGERLMTLENGPLRKKKSKTKNALPPSQWDPGKVYIDEVSFKVPGKIKTDEVKFVTSIARKSERLAITAGEKDTENQALVATVALGGATKAAATPVLRLDKLEAATKIKIDGKLDEAAWQTAPAIDAFVDPKTGRAAKNSPVQGKARMLWNADGLFLAVEVSDKDVVGGFKATDKDPQLWTKDAVELVVDPDASGDNKDYYDILINPQNLVFDSHYDDYNKPRTEPGGPFGHQEWSSNVKSKVIVDGTLDKSDDEDKGYTVEAMIPWKSFDKAKATPPAIGDTWRLNLYAVQQGPAVSWTPVLKAGEFHRASRFGRVLFAEKGYEKTAAPVTSGSAGVPAGKPSAATSAAVSAGTPVPKAPAPKPAPAAPTPASTPAP
jgi:hypothetical protein